MSKSQKVVLLVLHVLSDFLLLLLGFFIYLIFAVIGGIGDSIQGGGNSSSTQTTLTSLYFLVPIGVALLLDILSVVFCLSKKESTKARRTSVLVFEVVVCLMVTALDAYLIAECFLNLGEEGGIMNFVYMFILLFLLAGYLALHILTMKKFCFLKKKETAIS